MVQLDIEFTKEDNGNYIATINDDIITYVNGIIDNISLNRADIFFEQNNIGLMDTILARVASSVFIKKKYDIPDVGFLVIEVKVMERIIPISLGLLNYEEKSEYVCGILTT